jgi:hypothetical protein
LTDSTLTDELAVAPPAVGEFLQALAKALRTHQLYLPNNPIYQKAINTLQAAFAPLWADLPELSLDVYELELRWSGAVVYSQATRGESMSWLLYRDGVRNITLLPGVEDDEIVGVLDVLARARQLQAEDSDDLLTLLWAKDFQFIRYIVEEPPGDAGTPALPTASEVAPATTEAGRVRSLVEEEAPPAPTREGIVRPSDFNTTLYFLDDKEIAYLRAEMQREYAQDLRHNVLSMIFDVLELQPDKAVRAELIAVVESFLPYLLSAGDYRSVAYILQECRATTDRARALLPEHRKALEDLPTRLSGKEALSQLLQALDEAHSHPSTEELGALFSELRGEALPTLFEWLPRLSNARVRSDLDRAVERLATANVDRVAQALGTADPAMLAEVVALVGKLNLGAAVPALAGVLARADAAVRVRVVLALGEIGSPGAMQALERSLGDTDREVRLAAVRALAQRRYRGALGRIATLVNGTELRGRDLTERLAFFEAYGAMVGEDGVAVLDAMLNGRRLVRGKRDPETRACAALALGRIGSPSAAAALRAASDAKEPLVRNAVSSALRGITGARA